MAWALIYRRGDPCSFYSSTRRTVFFLFCFLSSPTTVALYNVYLAALPPPLYSPYPLYPPFFFFSFISLIADGPHHYHPACGHKGSSHLSPVHALQLFYRDASSALLQLVNQWFYTLYTLYNVYLAALPRPPASIPFPRRRDKKRSRSAWCVRRTLSSSTVVQTKSAMAPAKHRRCSMKACKGRG